VLWIHKKLGAGQASRLSIHTEREDTVAAAVNFKKLITKEEKVQVLREQLIYIDFSSFLLFRVFGNPG